jgi:hypothetical protein
VDSIGGAIYVYTPDAEAITRRVWESGIPVSNMLRRQASLEDVFLKLTDRRLVD